MTATRRTAIVTVVWVLSMRCPTLVILLVMIIVVLIALLLAIVVATLLLIWVVGIGIVIPTNNRLVKRIENMAGASNDSS